MQKLGLASGGRLLHRSSLVRLGAVGVASYLLGAVLLLITAQGGFDALGLPLGNDFHAFHAAARLAAKGELATAFDPSSFAQAAGETLPAGVAGYYWMYPPTFALFIMPLALLPFGAAFWVWTVLGLIVYGGGVFLLARDRAAVLAAFGFPAVWVAAYHGQNGFFLACLFMTMSYGLLARRDILAGVAIGLLAIKPQFALLIPFVLAASGRWRVFMAAAASVTVFAGVSVWVFGPDYLEALFGDGARLAGGIIFEERYWKMISSIFVAVKLPGGSTLLAAALHTIVALAVALLAIVRFRFHGVTRETLALLVAASLLIPPYVMDYDLIVLACSGALLFGRGASSNTEAFLALVVAMIPICVVGLGDAGLQTGWLAPMLTIAIVELRLRTSHNQRPAALSRAALT